MKKSLKTFAVILGAIFCAMPTFAQEAIVKKYKIKAEDIDIQGILKPYIKVADGTYDVLLTSDDGDTEYFKVSMTVKLEIKKSCNLEDIVAKLNLLYPEKYKGINSINTSDSFVLRIAGDSKGSLKEDIASILTFLDCEPGETQICTLGYYSSWYHGWVKANTLPEGNDATKIGQFSIDTTLTPR